MKGSTAHNRRPHPGFEVAAKCDDLILRLHRELQDLRERREQDAELAELNELARG